MEVFGIDVPVWLMLSSALLYMFYRWSTSTYDTFEKLNVPGPKPWPLVGNIMATFWHGIHKDQVLLYEKYKKVVGIYAGRDPIMLVFDPAMAKEILMKEFNSFRNRFRPGMNPPAISKMLFSMCDETWTHTRNLFSPSFSTSKLRNMNERINRSGRSLVNRLENFANAGEMFDGLQQAKFFTMDVIAGTVLGIDINAMRDSSKEFKNMANKVLKSSLYNLGLQLLFICPGMAPLVRRLGIWIFPKDMFFMFKKLVKKVIADRQQNPNEEHNDFLQLLMSAQNDNDREGCEPQVESDPALRANGKIPISKLKHLNPEEVQYTAMIFLFGGFDTVANPISMFLYLMACNQDCQQKLYEEITSVLKDGRDPTYEDLKTMKYLHMCMQETVRLFPATVRLMRVAKDDIEIKRVMIPKGMTVFIGTHSLHHDPDVWPDPDKFDPERFSAENKEGRDPIYWMPFGGGPRSCVAQRLGRQEIKIAALHVIRRFRVFPSEKTNIPIQMQHLKPEIKGGNWLRLERRE